MALHGMSMDASPAAVWSLEGPPGARSLRRRVRARERCLTTSWRTTYVRTNHSDYWIMLGFHSSRDIMTVEPRGWCSGETFHLGLALRRPASWEDGLVRCGLTSTTRTGVKSPPRESLPRMRRQAGQGC